jgi:uncharacterized OB-fold protein
MPVPLTAVDYSALVSDGADRGELRVQRCTRCERWIWFPRIACPYCFERSLEWRSASGQGTVVTASVIYRQHRRDYDQYVPIVLALIRLDEGCEMISNILGENRSDVKIGDRVRLAPGGRWSTLPQFELAAAP